MAEEKQELALQGQEQLLAAQNLVLEMIALGSPLEEVLRALASLIDRQEPDGMCCISLLDPDGRTLRLRAAPRLPEGLIRATYDLTIGPRSGACGTAAYRRERVVVSDIATDPLFDDFREVVLSLGLRSCWSTPILSSEGSVLGTLGVLHTWPHVPGEREINAVERATYLARIAIERRQFETRLQASGDHFQALIENTSDVIAILDVNGMILYLTPSVERVLGFHPGELIGAQGFDCFHPDDLVRAHRAFERALEQPGACLPIEQRFRHKNGSWRVLETVANNQLSNPAIGGVIVTGHDVTDRKLADEELISSQARYQELFENATDIIYTHDLAGTLTSFNKAGELLTGYSRAEALGMSVVDFIAPEYRALTREMIERKIGGETRTTYELEIISKQGIRIPIEVSTRLIFQMGRPVAVQGIARDVAERRNLESHLVQTQKMEAIGRLAGGVAHDFNNMLTVITGYGRWLLEQIPGGSLLAENAAEILLAADRAAALTNQLLAFSRNQIVQPIIFDLNGLVTRFDPMLRRLIGEDVELVITTSPDLGLIRADPAQIQQVVLNLVVNARDAMPEGGKLTIETANAEIGEESARAYPDWPPGDYVVLGVSDTGCGIDEQIKTHIFEPFFTTKEVGKGTGLGLSSVYGTVKQGGGFIRVESEPGTGAVFRIYFPRVVGVVSAGLVAPAESPRGGTETILLVEDEAVVRRAVGEMLRRLGYTVVEYPDPDLALKFVMESEKPLQLLLTDVVMPHLGGRELARRVKNLRGDIKVLFVSGYAEESLLHEDLARPGAAYLQKPFTPDTLAAKIRELLDAP
jgi:two-component system, cell cycle sensor histidine kinase and response regulator CckA